MYDHYVKQAIISVPNQYEQIAVLNGHALVDENPMENL